MLSNNTGPLTSHLALPHLPSMTAGQSLSSLQVPASPELVAQSPPAPVLPRLTWLLTRVAAEESSKILDNIVSQQH